MISWLSFVNQSLFCLTVSVSSSFYNISQEKLDDFLFHCPFTSCAEQNQRLYTSLNYEISAKMTESIKSVAYPLPRRHEIRSTPQATALGW